MKTDLKEIPVIVKRAILNPVTDIGQLSKEQKRNLEKYVKMGVLIKGRGGTFPKLKTVYALIGHNFIEARKEFIAEMNRIADYESKTKIK